MVNVTIGAAPRGLNLAHDIRLVKAALLYADRVTLVSPGAYYIHSIASFGELNTARAVATLIPIVQQLEPTLEIEPEVQELLLRLLNAPRAERRRLPKQVRREWGDLQKKLIGQLDVIRERVTSIGEQAGLSELHRALQSNLVELHAFELALGEDDDTIDQFVEQLKRTISAGTEYPLFDEQIASLVSSGFREGHFTAGTGANLKGRQIELAASLFRRLPLFEAASVADLIDIRRELVKPLTRFRAAVAEFASATSGTAWDIHFPAEVDQVVVQHIEPALLDIEEQIRSNSALRAFAQQTHVEQVASGSLVAYMLDHFAASSAIAAASAFGVAGAIAGVRATAQKLARSGEIRTNKLFFYYETKRRLSRT